ncbi:luciferase family protein [Pseudonocardia sp. RS010]|uniref:luciferase domain-containing protein n=1 Tax=Pseudonocardia sp. RS010 TaxID=3385979 RepID=UPI0039A16B5F
MTVGARSTGPGDEPMVARWGSPHPAAPLVLVLHGNGTSEHSMIEISPWLPHGPVAYVAVRAPLAVERGFAWFAETDGRPDPTGLVDAGDWLLRWLDTEGHPDRCVLLLAFRSGVALAGHLMLRAPERFSGAVLLHGAVPLDPAPPRGALRGMPVFLAHADADPRTPAPLLGRTWDWLRRGSGAPVRVARTPDGGTLAGSVVAAAGSWLGDRLDFLRAHGENPLPDGDEPTWPGPGRLPERAGEPPDTTLGLPQLPLGPPGTRQAALWDRIRGLGREGPAVIGPAGTRALFLDGPADPAAVVHPAQNELVHLHPDGSLHLALPDALLYDALGKGWALAHPLAGVRLAAGLVLVPAPRDDAEVEVVAALVTAAHRAATGGGSAPHLG